MSDDVLPPDAPIPQEPHGRGDFKGTGGELFLIWLKNALLTALTLGLYFAWAKVRLYRFFYSNTEFAGARFRFTGTPKEIFLGTLKALGVLFSLFVLFIAGVAGATALKLKFVNIAAPFAFYAAILFLSQYALYATMGYRASRARYREIAFRLEGSPWAFAREAAPYLLLGIVTAGLALPYYAHWRIKRIYSNLRFGDLRFVWDAPVADYWKLCLKGYFLSLLTLGVYYFFWFPRYFAFVRGHLSLDGCRFHGEIKPGEFAGLMITNLLLVVATFGLATPWALVRSLRFFLTRLTLDNPSRLAAALQPPRQKVSAYGEAMADGMDMGVGLGF